MTEPLSLDGLRRWVAETYRLAKDRTLALSALQVQRARAELDEERHYREACDALQDAEAEAVARQQSEGMVGRDSLQQQLSAEIEQIERLSRQLVERVEREYAVGIATAKQERDDVKWLANSVLDEAAPDSPAGRLHALRQQMDSAESEMAEYVSRVDVAYGAAAARLKACGIADDADPMAIELPADYRLCLEETSNQALAIEQLAARLLRRPLGYLMQWPRPLMLFLLCASGLYAVVAFGLDPAMLQPNLRRNDRAWHAIGAAVGVLVSGLMWLLAWAAARSDFRNLQEQLWVRVQTARRMGEYWKSSATAELARREDELEKAGRQRDARRQHALQAAEAKYVEREIVLQGDRRRQLQANELRTAPLLERLRLSLSQQLTSHDEQTKRDGVALTQVYVTQRQELERLHAAGLQAIAATDHEQHVLWNQRWLAHREDLARTAAEWRHQCNQTAPPAAVWLDAAPVSVIPAVLPAGDLHWPALTPPGDANEAGVAEAAERDELSERTMPQIAKPRAAAIEQVSLTDLDALPQEGPLPLALQISACPSFVVRTQPGTRATTIALLQVMMLRWLTCLPPGKVRFTVLDPVGLGESFAPFMHLADIDELLISGRIWTEPSQIEQRLAQLTEHMETVFQTYLRNEFRSIDDYNAQAGELAEPYRIVVAADVPEGMTDLALRRLNSIAQGGARCGVFLLVSVDHGRALEPLFSAECLQRAVVLEMTPTGPQVCDSLLKTLTLAAPELPSPHELGLLVKTAGQRAKQARRVEVPFDRIAPQRDAWWTGSTATGLSIPVGRTGAKKQQALVLGRGTSQHVLIAGKTGSGKSTLLHAIVVSGALQYGPDELEFYLIDFKKGVEFKCYATGKLPHARVIAIESDREFGVSVLERLDQLLKDRGEEFRRAGVQDLAGFRTARPQQPMPRVLLLIDEFQEFFTEDDGISQSAALLLDRLIRQGRAFGVHVVLGSQTLSGAYSLARSTLGQVAVRIALQCSETDAHLILSEDNSAARLLTRPGEAIYNDANGLVEGNHPFQVVWLADAERDALLEQLDRHAQRGGDLWGTALVFEGHLPGRLATNRVLTERLAGRAANEARLAVTAEPSCWLGEPAAIRPPAETPLVAQSGANVLVIGQPAESAAGVLGALVTSLWAQADLRSEIRALLGGLPEAVHHQGWHEMAQVLPGIRTGTPGETKLLLQEWTAELERRQGEAGPPWLCVISDLGRFRDLRKSDDDYGFGSMDAGGDTPPAKRFATLLKEGPAVGLHFAVWAATLQDAQRWLSRESMQQFEYRVLFQMSAGDSSTLIDSPAASRLGPNRALLSRGDLGSLEKFRPYEFPRGRWWEVAEPAARVVVDNEVVPEAAVIEEIAPAEEWQALDGWSVN